MADAANCVRYVRHGVRYRVRLQTLAIAGLCGMCGTLSIVRACARVHTRAGARAHAHPSRTYRTYRTGHAWRGFHTAHRTARHAAQSCSRARQSFLLPCLEEKVEGEAGR